MGNLQTFETKTLKTKTPSFKIKTNTLWMKTKTETKD